MKITTDNFTDARTLLKEYAVELWNETPILNRYTDALPMPDGRGGYAERERYEAERRMLKYPQHETAIELAICTLTAFRDNSDLWELTRDGLLLQDRRGEADILERRRNRRNADIDKMIYILTTALNTSGLDFREWEEAADNFNTGIAGDVAQIERILQMPPHTIAQRNQDGYTEADRKRDMETNEAALWAKGELERKKKNAQKTGRKNQRNGEKNDNGRKTDAKLKNQIMTEVRQTVKNNHCSQSNACQIVANKHLKADGKTPIFSKRTIENWMSAATAKKKAKNL